jgi:hypothetical protein
MDVRRFARPAFAGAVLILAAAAANPAQAPGPLDRIERGLWQLREADGSVRSVCISEPRMLLQIRHGSAQCSHFAIPGSPDRVTIRYTCSGQGHGRTSILVETPRLVRVETQGIASGAPFQMEYEGRLSGPCTGRGGSR